MISEETMNKIFDISAVNLYLHIEGEEWATNPDEIAKCIIRIIEDDDINSEDKESAISETIGFCRGCIVKKALNPNELSNQEKQRLEFIKKYA